jgi:hypothetical protein
MIIVEMLERELVVAMFATTHSPGNGGVPWRS